MSATTDSSASMRDPSHGTAATDRGAVPSMIGMAPSTMRRSSDSDVAPHGGTDSPSQSYSAISASRSAPVTSTRCAGRAHCPLRYSRHGPPSAADSSILHTPIGTDSDQPPTVSTACSSTR